MALLRQYQEYAVAALAGFILILFTFVKFIAVPYSGFVFNPASGQITYVDQRAIRDDPLFTGDRILQVGEVTWEDYRKNLRQPLLTGARPGDRIAIRVDRSGASEQVEWVLPEPSFRAVLGRLSTLWLPYVFWIAGTASLFLLRPKDNRRRLVVAFNYLTALWLIAGSISYSHLWHSAVILRMAVWLCLPVYLHLHWLFPQPIRRLPAAIVWAIYLLGFGLAAAEWFQLLPPTLFLLGFLAAVTGSIALLAFHAILRPEQRRDLGLLGLAVSAILLPAIALGVTRLLGSYPAYGGGALLVLPVLPGAYFYAVYRRQLGGLELRANRTIGLILYLILLFSVSVLALSLAQPWLDVPYAAITVGTAAALLSGLGGILLYPAFQRWVERRLLGMPLPPTGLLEAYTARMVTSLEMQLLVKLIRDEVLPSLLIRQAALLRLEREAGGTPSLIPVVTLGIEPDQLPQVPDLPALIAQAGRPRTPDEEIPCAWVRLVLPLSVNDQTAGLCLLGQRDPDDEYAANEIPILQALMDQTALALLNVEQAERLRTLSQINIERLESERRMLALELHDEVLGQMALLRNSVNETQSTTQFLQAYQTAVEHIREIISGLYPGMLMYGLRVALEELGDLLSTQAGDGLRIEIDLPEADTRYPATVELHVYRIIQQACQNAIHHAQASRIHLQGELEEGSIRLVVQDDGIGFDASGQLDLPWLLANRHFGLAGIYERAAFIGARVEIYSRPGQGTEVSVSWRADSASSWL